MCLLERPSGAVGYSRLRDLIRSTRERGRAPSMLAEPGEGADRLRLLTHPIQLENTIRRTLEKPG